MFEDFQLADYGNRIPSLSFEVEADAEVVSVAAIAEALSGGAILAGDSPDLVGYAATGNSVRGAIEALTSYVPLSLTDEEGQLLLGTASAEPVVLGGEGSAVGQDGGVRDEHVRQAAATIPTSVTLAYHDPSLDCQTGLQRAFRGGAALVAEQNALPATIAADGAKQLAEARLAALWAGRENVTLHRSWRDAGLRPGRTVRLEGKAGLWRIERWLLEKMVVRLQLVGVAGGAAPPAAANPGRPVSEADLRHGPTTLRLLELPALGEPLADRPLVFAAAAGVEPGWRRAALMAGFDGGTSWQELGQTAAPAVIGSTETALAPGGSALIDEQASCVVRLLAPSMDLEARSDSALVAGANLALIGDELIQFGSVEALGGRRFRLSRLLRGRFGTEWAAGTHGVGEDFLLVDRAALLAIDAPASSIGGEAQLVASGIEDGPEGVKVTRLISGEALKPPSPVHVRVERSANGDLRLSWVRRSRIGWTWRDASDIPLGEESERYQVTIAGSGFVRRAEAAAPSFTYLAADQAADGAVGQIVAEIVQVGSLGRSRPAALVITV